VPLGDLLERRSLIAAHFLALTLALALAALAPGGLVLALASLLIGMGATAAQQVVPMAAALASPSRRGAVVGGVMSGLLAGILLSRALAGLVGARLGWRAMFWMGIPLALLGAACLRPLPRNRAGAGLGYRALLRSLLGLWRQEPRLRRAAFTQAMLFGSFSVFWTVLALRLEGAPFHRGADVAGLFGIIGTAGVLAAPLAGRIADRRGPSPVVALGSGTVLAGWLVLALWGRMAGLVAGVLLLDFGVQSALIAHQQLVFGLRPEARNRLNTLFMTAMFLGGSLGSAGAMLAWHRAGWGAVSVLGLALAAAASLPALASFPQKHRAHR
jgi:predicted MFS family arabinose efflux permease